MVFGIGDKIMLWEGHNTYEIVETSKESFLIQCIDFQVGEYVCCDHIYSQNSQLWINNTDDFMFKMA